MLFFLSDFFLSLFLLEGLNEYYGLGEDSEIALVGHSHLMLGIDKETIEKKTGLKVSKYTREGVNVADREIMVRQLLKSNPRVGTLIYGVDAWTFSSEGLSSNSYKLFYPFLDDESIEGYLYDNSTIDEYITKKIIRTTRYDELLFSSSMRGYLHKWTNLKFGNVDLKMLKGNIANGRFRKIENSMGNIMVLRETLALLSEKNINVILLYVPTIDLLSNALGPEYNKTIDIFNELAVEYDNVEFLNLQEPWSHNHDIFYDPIHLNPHGQIIITEELNKYLKENGYY
ncbi:MAG: hypothetical protein CR994_08125 [Maribacter sp.]|nr:MAG: hypothetical protein CR994_08125 [Maribacter sp.]